MKDILAKILRISLYAFSALTIACAVLFLIGRPQKNIAWGITFSSIRAQELGFNPPDLLRTILADLHPDKVRIPAYWSELEPEQDQFDFTMIDSLLNEAKLQQGTEVVVVLGKKQPRWPECHQPQWVNSLAPEQQEQVTLNMISKTVSHLKNSKAITAWQIENEPYFQYGPECPVTSKSLYETELATVRQLDSRPLIATDSGEKGMWINAAWSGADILGTTMYREVYHDKKGKYLTYPLPGWTYNIKAGLVKLLTGADEVIGVELQAEPWLIVSNPTVTAKEEQLKHMNEDIFRNNIEYAAKVGLPENYLWGAEWWYWMQKEHSDSTMVNAAKELFNETIITN